MKLSEIKMHLETAGAVNFQLPDGAYVPGNFHVTEVGIVSKDFIDCGGVLRSEKVANFQLWNADDDEHKLKPGKLLKIIALSEKVLKMPDLEIEVEYQTETIGKYDLGFNGTDFLLLAKQTDCLAKDSCGIPGQSEKQIPAGGKSTCCSPSGNCC